MSRLVYGVGINDADYAVEHQVTVNGIRTRTWRCPFYKAWKDMLKRCYSEAFQASSRSYLGCSVSSEWLRFSVFRSWMISQDWIGKELDKDILHPGNKTYGPDRCVFVTHKLNSFTVSNDATRGEWPLGVSFNKKRGRLEAQCSNPFTGKREFLGFFLDQDTAHQAWLLRKHQLACQYADLQSDPRVADALRKRYAIS